MANIAATAVQLTANTGQYQAKMSEAAKHTHSVMNKMSKSLDSIKKSSSFTAMASGFTAAVAGIGMVANAASFAADKIMNVSKALIDFTVNSAAAIDELNDMSAKTDLSVTSLSRLGYAAQLSGTDLDSITGAYKKFSTIMGKAGFVGDLEQEFFSALAYLGDIPDYAQRAAEGAKLFGKSWSEMGGIIKLSTGDWETMIADADRFGVTISGPVSQSIGEAFDKFDMLNARVKGFGNVLAGAVSPYAIASFDAISEYMDKMGMNASNLNAILEKMPEFIDASLGGAAKVLPDIEKSIAGIASAAVMIATVLSPIVDSMKVLGDQVGAPFKIISSLKNKDFEGYMSGLSSLLAGPSAYLAKQIVGGNNPLAATTGALKAGAAISPVISSMSEGKNSETIVDLLKKIAKVGSDQLAVQKSNDNNYAVLAP